MQRAMVINRDNSNIIVEQGELANTFLTRLKGLLGRKSMNPGEGLLICPCDMVHSIGMKMEIDVLFVSQDNRIVNIIEKMAPNRISKHIKNSCYVIELPSGQIARTKTQHGQELCVVFESNR
ncbi:MAG: DUF192 domain-containing protein [Syntrophomonas sp.]